MIFALRARKPRYCKPADDGADLPGGDDYGDSFVPDDDDVAAARATGRGVADDADPPPRGKDKSRSRGEDEDEGKAEVEGGGADDLRTAVDESAAKDDDADKESTGTPRTGKGKFIPLDRHEKLLKKERARREEAEAQLQQSRAGQTVARVNEDLTQAEDELVSMEGRYNDLLAEGDTKGAAALMTQIRRKNAELNQLTATQRDAEVMARAVEKVRYEEALDRIEEAYPELNPDSESYDEDTYQDVVDLMAAGQRRGLSATKALQRAVERTLGADTSTQRRATSVTPRVDEDDVASKRRGDAVKRNLDAARRTPPATHRVGAGNDAAGGALTAKAVMDMDDDEFAKLDEKDLAKLRGDSL